MKTNFFLILLIVLSSTTIALNATTNENNTNDSQTSSNNNSTQKEDNNQKYSRWSIGASAGIAILDADQSQSPYTLIPSSNINFAFSGKVEYAINPIFSLFAQYSNTPYSGIKLENSFKGISHEATLNGAFDILNLFEANRKSTRWKLNVNVGAGLGFYKSEIKNSTSNTLVENINGYSMIIPIGFSVEYTPINQISIFLDTRYSMYQEDDLDAYISGKSNDNMIYAGIGLKYNIGATKSKRSVQNVCASEYSPSIQLEETNAQIEDINSQIDHLTDLINNSVVPDIDDLKSNNKEDNLDSDGDGVPDSRDRHANTPAGSFVNYYGEPLDAEKINKILGRANSASSNVPSVYFNTNETNLTAIGENVVIGIAKEMFNDASLKLQIVGYCDNTGSEAYNTELSIKRSESIKNLLIKKYGIAKSRITIVGKGKVESEKKRLTLNRRCDLILSK